MEHPGSGVPRILNIYGKDSFKIRDSYLRVTFYYDDTIVKTSVKTSAKTSVKLLELLVANPEMTLAEVAEVLEKSVRAIELASAKLVKAGKLKYVDPQKGGHWEVTRENAL